MTRHLARAGRSAAVRAIGGERNAIRAEQLRALGRGEPAVARDLGVDPTAVVRWFEVQDDLVICEQLGGAA